ncbi:MAG: cupredoxin domain-containing protein [Alicyclobacillus sp.]|nr:cupredoxin domain-containing protein [Alicyclobacillus sp.]
MEKSLMRKWGAVLTVLAVAGGAAAGAAGCGATRQGPAPAGRSAQTAAGVETGETAQPTTLPGKASSTGKPGKSDDQAQNTVVVHMGNFAFQPVTLHVTAGTTVVWDNDDTMPHAVTSGANRSFDGRFNSGDLEPGQTFSYTFKKPGVYPYYCIYHPTMNGTVLVTAASLTASEEPATVTARAASAAQTSLGTSGGMNGMHMAPVTMDTIDTAPGTTYNLAFTPEGPGKWLFHCHILPHVTSGTDMSGMITVFDVKPR